MSEIVQIEKIESRIFQIRGKRVMLDRDLAVLYEVETRILIQAVKRNIKRFPDDFMFRLTTEETAIWRSQIVISKNCIKNGIRPLRGVLRQRHRMVFCQRQSIILCQRQSMVGHFGEMSRPIAADRCRGLMTRGALCRGD